MESLYSIYKITNQLDGTVYIGQTEKTYLERWEEHKYRACQPWNYNQKLYVEMHKYGTQNFKIQELLKCHTQEEVWELEAFLIGYYDSYRHGYNSNQGNIIISKTALLYRIALNTFDIIQEYNNIDTAVKLTGYKKSDIYRCCLHPEFVYENSYWCYADNYLLLKSINEDRRRSVIRQYDKSFSYIIRTFASYAEVYATMPDTTMYDIFSACAKHKMLNNYYWILE